MRSKIVVGLLILIVLASFYSISYAGQPNPTTLAETLIEQAMDDKTFRLCGLDKLTKRELQKLNEWLGGSLKRVYDEGYMEGLIYGYIAETKRESETKVVVPQPRLRKTGDLEEAIIVKDFDGDKVIIERANGEKWILEAKTWCSWSWRYEGRKVLLKFGYVSSELINDDGDVCKFWTEEEIY